MTVTKKVCTALVVLALAIVPLQGQYNVLHSFSGGTGGGSPHQGALTLDSNGTTLYGMASLGGQWSSGVIFKVETDGSGYSVLYSFDGQGTYPNGSLIRSGTTLYGMTPRDALSDTPRGMIFKIGTDGGGFTKLHAFAGGTTDGSTPWGDLLLIGSTLYGMTEGGGSAGGGVVFKIDTDGNNFALLHSFAGGVSDGASPQSGALATDGTYLYGMTKNGGAADCGVVFKIKISDSTFSLVRVFAGNASNDGAYPHGQPVLFGSTLYGLTYGGGGASNGTIFKVDTNGSNYTVLRRFQQSGSDGFWPEASPTLNAAGTRLYGTTDGGGDSSGLLGTIFGIDTDGTDYMESWVFASSATGSNPRCTLLLNGTTAYGTTIGGGLSSKGTIFSFDTQPTANVWVSKWTDNYTPVAGTNMGFTIQVHNTGPWPATGVQVTDLLPAELTYIGDSPDLGTYDHTTGIWDIGSLSKGGTATMSLNVKVNSSGTITNYADKTAQNENDTNSADHHAYATITTTPTKNLQPPVLLSPASGATGQPATATLKWLDTNATPQEVKYKLRIKKQGGTYVTYALAQNTTQYIKSNLAAGKTYFWNVQAVGNGTTTKTSAWANGGVDWSFTVVPPVTLTPPTLLTPASGATDQPLSLTLYWGDTNSSPNELHYKVRFKVAGGAYTVTTLGPDVTSLAKTSLRSGKTYYWSVMAVGNGTSIKNSVWPADFHFTTGIIR